MLWFKVMRAVLVLNFLTLALWLGAAGHLYYGLAYALAISLAISCHVDAYRAAGPSRQGEFAHAAAGSRVRALRNAAAVSCETIIPAVFALWASTSWGGALVVFLSDLAARALVASERDRLAGLAQDAAQLVGLGCAAAIAVLVCPAPRAVTISSHMRTPGPLFEHVDVASCNTEAAAALFLLFAYLAAVACCYCRTRAAGAVGFAPAQRRLRVGERVAYRHANNSFGDAEVLAVHDHGVGEVRYTARVGGIVSQAEASRFGSLAAPATWTTWTARIIEIFFLPFTLFELCALAALVLVCQEGGQTVRARAVRHGAARLCACLCSLRAWDSIFLSALVGSSLRQFPRLLLLHLPATIRDSAHSPVRAWACACALARACVIVGSGGSKCPRSHRARGMRNEQANVRTANVHNRERERRRARRANERRERESHARTLSDSHVHGRRGHTHRTQTRADTDTGTDTPCTDTHAPDAQTDTEHRQTHWQARHTRALVPRTDGHAAHRHARAYTPTRRLQMQTPTGALQGPAHKQTLSLQTQTDTDADAGTVTGRHAGTHTPAHARGHGRAPGHTDAKTATRTHGHADPLTHGHAPTRTDGRWDADGGQGMLAGRRTARARWHGCS